MDLALDELFREAMAHLASGVAVITARRPDGRPCGIAATALVSYSARPPSLLVSIWHGSRCHDALARCERFGVHLLRADQLELAHRFADRESADKFAGLDWSWDEDVPELGGRSPTCAAPRGELRPLRPHDPDRRPRAGRFESGEPLVYARRRMDWLMPPMMP